VIEASRHVRRVGVLVSHGCVFCNTFISLVCNESNDSFKEESMIYDEKGVLHVQGSMIVLKEIVIVELSCMCVVFVVRRKKEVVCLEKLEVFWVEKDESS
jgi:phage gp45-like